MFFFVIHKINEFTRKLKPKGIKHIWIMLDNVEKT